MYFNLEGEFIQQEVEYPNDEVVITLEELPQSAQDFIAMHFPNHSIHSIEKDNYPDSNDSVYSVRFSDGLEIDFDGNGDWQEVDAGWQEVPMSVIPEQIQVYVNQNFNGVKIHSIDKENNQFEIELSNQKELVFDFSANFLYMKS